MWNFLPVLTSLFVFCVLGISWGTRPSWWFCLKIQFRQGGSNTVETSVKQTPSGKALILLIGPTEKQDKTATHDHCLLKVKIWVVYPTFSAESCKGPLVGVKRKRTIKERERKLKKKGRKEGRKKKENNIYQQKQFLQVWNPRFFACQEKSLPLHKLDKQIHYW